MKMQTKEKLTIVSMNKSLTIATEMVDDIPLIQVEYLEYDSNLGRDIPSLICIKGNNQNDRTNTQKSYILQRFKQMGENVYYGRVGSPREPSEGKIARFHLNNSVIPAYEQLEAPSPLSAMYEPHEVSFQYGLTVTVENDSVTLIDTRASEIRKISSPWFKSLHTAQLIPDEEGELNRMLVSSTGIDTVLLLDITKTDPDVISYWSAFNMPKGKTKSGRIFRVEDTGKITEINNDGNVINNFDIKSLHPAGFANGNRVLCINSAKHIGGKVVVTSFHTGEVASIELGNPDSYKLIAGGYKNPHSLDMASDTTSSIISTSEGIWYYNHQGKTTAFDFRGLPGKSPEDSSREWLQTATRIGQDLYAIVDVNRRQITLLDVKKRKYRIIPFDRKLSIQMIAANELEI